VSLTIEREARFQIASPIALLHASTLSPTIPVPTHKSPIFQPFLEVTQRAKQRMRSGMDERGKRFPGASSRTAG
jgi:hypothetical protein